MSPHGTLRAKRRSTRAGATTARTPPWYGGGVAKTTRARGAERSTAASALGVARALATTRACAPHPGPAGQPVRRGSRARHGAGGTRAAGGGRERLEGREVGVDGAGDRRLHGRGGPAAEFVIPGHATLRLSSTWRARCCAGRTADRGARRREDLGDSVVSKYVNRASDLVFAMRASRTCRTPSCSRGGASRPRSKVKVSARRRKGLAHTVTFEKPHADRRRAHEPGGTDTGPRPTALLGMSLASCTAITIEMYADRKGWDVGDLEVEVDDQLDPKATSCFDVVLNCRPHCPTRRWTACARSRGSAPCTACRRERSRSRTGSSVSELEGNPSAPSIGLFAANHHADGREALGRLGPLAEELGYDSLWMGEHVVVPDPHVPPVADAAAGSDPRPAGSARASWPRARSGSASRPASSSSRSAIRSSWPRSSRASTLVSGGRLVFGMGVGDPEPETTAIGVPMERRRRAPSSTCEAMRALWEHERPSYEGEFVRFSGVNARPRPLQSPSPCRDGRAQRRGASARGAPRQRVDGFFLDLDATSEQLEGLRPAWPKPTGTSPISRSRSPARRIDAEAVEPRPPGRGPPGADAARPETRSTRSRPSSAPTLRSASRPRASRPGPAASGRPSR